MPSYLADPIQIHTPSRALRSHTDLIHIYTPSRTLRSHTDLIHIHIPSRALRSTKKMLLHVPRSRWKNRGERSRWLAQICGTAYLSESLESFKLLLKTHLYSLALHLSWVSFPLHLTVFNSVFIVLPFINCTILFVIYFPHIDGCCCWWWWWCQWYCCLIACWLIVICNAKINNNKENQ